MPPRQPYTVRSAEIHVVAQSMERNVASVLKVLLGGKGESGMDQMPHPAKIMMENSCRSMIIHDALSFPPSAGSNRDSHSCWRCHSHFPFRIYGKGTLVDNRAPSAGKRGSD